MATTIDPAELSALIGADSRRVSVRGRDFTLRPLNLAQVADALEVLARITQRGAAVSALLGGGDFDPVQMLLRGGRDILDLLAIAACDPARYLEDSRAARAESFAFVAGLDAAEGAQLLGEVYKINVDFFDGHRTAILEALAPVTGDVVTLANAIVQKLAVFLSQLLFNLSSPRATASKPSEVTA